MCEKNLSGSFYRTIKFQILKIRKVIHFAIFLCGIISYTIFQSRNFKKKKKNDKIVVSVLVCDDTQLLITYKCNLVGVIQCNQVNGLVYSYAFTLFTVTIYTLKLSRPLNIRIFAQKSSKCVI